MKNCIVAQRQPLFWWCRKGRSRIDLCTLIQVGKASCSSSRRLFPRRPILPPQPGAFFSLYTVHYNVACVPPSLFSHDTDDINTSSSPFNSHSGSQGCRDMGQSKNLLLMFSYIYTGMAVRIGAFGGIGNRECTERERESGRGRGRGREGTA